MGPNQAEEQEAAQAVFLLLVKVKDVTHFPYINFMSAIYPFIELYHLNAPMLNSVSLGVYLSALE